MRAPADDASPTPPSPSARRPATRWLALGGIVAVAANLRPGLTVVGPLVPRIRAETGLSDPALGLLTALPLLAFGVVSLLTAPIGRRVGIERALLLGLVLIGGGAAMRGVPSIGALFAGTLLLGVGIALGNVLLPVLAKRDHPDRYGAVTSLYSSVMGVGATVGAAASVPLALRLGWRGALAAWAIPAVVALGIWMTHTRGSPRPLPAARPKGGLRRLLRSGLAWWVALYMGFQSLTFYVVLAWLPDYLQARGIAAIEAGWLFALVQATSVVGTAVVPVAAGRLRDQGGVVWALVVIEAAALAALALEVGGAALWVTVGALGFMQGGTFGLALIFLVVRARDTDAAGELSGMAQSVGYLLAAAGPPIVGALLQWSGGWGWPLGFLVFVMGGKLVSGLPASRPRWVPAGGSDGRGGGDPHPG